MIALSLYYIKIRCTYKNSRFVRYDVVVKRGLLLRLVKKTSPTHLAYEKLIN